MDCIFDFVCRIILGRVQEGCEESHRIVETSRSTNVPKEVQLKYFVQTLTELGGSAQAKQF